MGIEAAVINTLIAIGVGAKTAAAIYAFGQFLAVTALSTLLTKRSLPGSPPLAARTITSRGTVDPQQIIYGEALVGGTLAYRNTHGTRNRDLWAVHMIAGHECQAITDVYLDSRVIAESIINGGAAAGGVVSSGFYAPTRRGNTVEIYKYLGTSTQTADAALITASGSDWTSAHRLRGITYAVTKFLLSDTTEDVWEAGDPANVKFLVRGKKLYDPRLDSTQPGGSGAHRLATPSTWVWSDNPALCLADFLMDAKFSAFAGGISSTRIDWPAVMQAADDCDTLVFIPPAASPQNTQKRFTCNGVLYGSADMRENISAILGCMNGTLVFTSGMYIMAAGVYESPVDSIDEHDIIGPIGVTSALDSDRRVNTIKGTYIDPLKGYEPTEIPPVTGTVYKDTRDGGQELIETIEMTMVDSFYQAQRIAIKRLAEANQELTLSVPCNLRAARLVPGERVNLTIVERGWTPKIFKVLGWEFFDRGGSTVGVNLELREDDAAAYADPDIADYSVISPGGLLTIADVTPIPSIDSLPRGINYGGGTTNIILHRNFLWSAGALSANDGEIALTRGRFILPDGTVRSLEDVATVWTNFESSYTPPDGRFYVIWGATNPQTRFPSSPLYDFGDGTAEAAGLFAAVYDRTREQWYAVTNTADQEIAFTPAATDYIFAAGIKTSASGGIDTLTPVVQYVELQYPRNLVPGSFSDFESVGLSDMRFSSNMYGGSVNISSTNYLGSRSLQLVYPAAGMGGWAEIEFNFNSVLGFDKLPIKVPPNRRYLVVAHFNPSTYAVAAGVQMQFNLLGASSAVGPIFTCENLTAGQWAQMTIEIDATAVSAKAFTLKLFFRNPSAITAQSTINIDALMLFDVTDNPEMQADWPD